jgi:hypothetical protein
LAELAIAAKYPDITSNRLVLEEFKYSETPDEMPYLEVRYSIPDTEIKKDKPITGTKFMETNIDTVSARISPSGATIFVSKGKSSHYRSSSANK